MNVRRLHILVAATLSAALPSLSAAQSAEHTVVRPGPRTGPVWLGLTLKSKPAAGSGVEVTGFLRRSPAEESGVRIGDVVVAVDGVTVDSLQQIHDVVRRRASGDKIDVMVRRGEASRKLTFVLATMPPGEEIVRSHLLGFDAPEFTFRFVGDGKDVHLSELRGKPTIIDFWATWCTPCRRVQSELAQVKERFGEQINIVGVSDETAKTVRAHLERHPAKYAMAVDDGASRSAYAVQSIPMVVVLDAEHRVAAIVFGADQRELLERKLQNLLPAPK